MESTLLKIVEKFPPKKLLIRHGKVEKYIPVVREDSRLLKIVDAVLGNIAGTVDRIEVELSCSRYMFDIYGIIDLENVKRELSKYEIYYGGENGRYGITVPLISYDDAVKILEELVDYSSSYVFGIDKNAPIYDSIILEDTEKLRYVLSLLARLYSAHDIVPAKLVLSNEVNSFEVSPEDLERLAYVVTKLNTKTIIVDKFIISIGAGKTDKIVEKDVARDVLDILKSYRVIYLKLNKVHYLSTGYELTISASPNTVSRILERLGNKVVDLVYDNTYGNVRNIQLIIGRDDKHVEEVRRALEEYRRMLEEMRRRAMKSLEEYEDIEYHRDYYDYCDW